MSTSKPRIWTVALAVVAVVIVQGIVGTVVVVAALSSRPNGALGAGPDEIRALIATPTALAGLLAGSFFSLVFVAGFATWLGPRPWRRRLSMPSLRAGPLDVLLVVLCALGFGMITQPLARLLGAYDESTLKALHDAVMSASLPMAAVLALFGVLVAAFEEVFYRGYMQSRLASRVGVRGGVVLTALVFGAMHFDLVQGTFAFLFGLLVGAVAVRTRSIATGMYAHGFNNLLAFTMPRFFEDSSQQLDEPVAIGMLIGVVFVLAAGSSLYRRLRARPAEEVPDDDAPPSDGSRRRPLVVVGLSGCALMLVLGIGAVVVIGSVMKTMTNLPGADRMKMIGERAGAFGLDHDDRACVDEALEIARTCTAANELGCAQSGRLFLTGCLARATPSSGFCDDVPGIQDFMAITTWTSSECQALGGDPTACALILRSIPQACEHRL